MINLPNPEADALAFRLAEIIASMKSNKGTHELWILELEEALEAHDAEADKLINFIDIQERTFKDEA